jgi:hypothetical protein
VSGPPAIHPQLEPLAFLIGSWTGDGRGIYPSIDDFSYREEVNFGHDGRPFLSYEQRTFHPETGAPMHREIGFWRHTGDGKVEVMLAHNIGQAELSLGRVEGTTVRLTTDSLTPSPSAKSVEGLERTYTLKDDVLHYEMHMAFSDHAMQNHLSAMLKRVPA